MQPFFPHPHPRIGFVFRHQQSAFFLVTPFPKSNYRQSCPGPIGFVSHDSPRSQRHREAFFPMPAPSCRYVKRSKPVPAKAGPAISAQQIGFVFRPLRRRTSLLTLFSKRTYCSSASWPIGFVLHDLLLSSGRISHHRGTECTENQSETVFVSESRGVSAISVPPW